LSNKCIKVAGDGQKSSKPNQPFRQKVIQLDEIFRIFVLLRTRQHNKAPAITLVFLFEIIMNQKDEEFIKGIIKEILALQNKILLTGGYHSYSDGYCRYQYHIRHLIKRFNLPAHPEIVSQLFDFPLSLVINITNHCAVDRCPHMAKQMSQAFRDWVKYESRYHFRKYPHLWSIKARVEWVYSNLIMLTDDSFPLPI